MDLVSLALYGLGAFMTLAMFEHPDIEAIRMPWYVKLTALIIWPCIATVVLILWVLETLNWVKK